MREIWIWALLTAFAAAGLAAQTPDGLKLDAPRARVLVATEQPHHAGALHEHKVNRVMIYLGDGEMSFTSPNGKVDKVQVKKGQVLWSPASGPHIS